MNAVERMPLASGNGLPCIRGLGPPPLPRRSSSKYFAVVLVPPSLIQNRPQFCCRRIHWPLFAVILSVFVYFSKCMSQPQTHPPLLPRSFFVLPSPSDPRWTGTRFCLPGEGGGRVLFLLKQTPSIWFRKDFHHPVLCNSFLENQVFMYAWVCLGLCDTMISNKKCTFGLHFWHKAPKNLWNFLSDKSQRNVFCYL